MSLSYKPIRAKRIVIIFVLSVCLSPVFLFLLLFVASSTANGLDETFRDMKDMLHELNYNYVILTATVFSALMTFSDVLSIYTNNYKWKRMFSLNPLQDLQQKGFVLSHEGLDGKFNNTAVSIRYRPGRHEETMLIIVYRKEISGGPVLHVKNVYAVCQILNDRIVYVTDIRGRKRRDSITIMEPVQELIRTAHANGIQLKNTI